jgi:hypothetical protein
VLEEYITEEQRLLCTFLLWAKVLNVKDIHKEIFPVYGENCLSRKSVQNWVDTFSQGRSKVADDAQLGRPVEIATEPAVQRVEESFRAERRITIDSVSTALGCFDGLAHSTIHDLLSFGKCAHGGCPVN